MAVLYADSTFSLSEVEEFPVTPGHSVENYSMGVREFYNFDKITDQVNFKAVIYMHGSGGHGRLAADNPLVKAITDKGYALLSVSGLGSPYSSKAPWTYGYGNVMSPMLYGRMIKAFWQTQATVEALVGKRMGVLIPTGFQNGFINTNSTAEGLSTPSGSTRTTHWVPVAGAKQFRVKLLQGESNRLRLQWRMPDNSLVYVNNHGSSGLSDEPDGQYILDVPEGATEVRIYYATAAAAASDPEISISIFMPVALLGHSLGAQQAFSWASLVKEVRPRSASLVNYIIGNGATIAGSGNFRWNHIHRNIAAYSNIFRRITHPAIAYYSDDDGFCPRDFSERLRMTLKPDQDNLYFISPGALGHSWFSQRPDLVANHLEQMFNGEPITIDSTDPESALAVPGP
ncbi:MULTISPECIES: alpha/beta fold hydrolase [unclassified Halomonas]|uniref:alpha/beta fold hydrolase n=1 Tax=unclassified Halomonas TaxID=2609666 RepID=UPI000990584E|nr:MULTISPECIES: hypothetical protein [unclassified Halomonas]AQU83257.1 hypothetical protein B2G49_12180 [Halomonas sp. 'Soap Lake \